MLTTSSRLLSMLSLLQSRPTWSGAELAEHFGVSTRTIRTDIGKLRDLGYPIESVPGVGGYYQFGVGAKLPPLLLDDDEAVAVAIGLGAVAGVAGVDESAARALGKLERVLPQRLRSQVVAITEATSRGPDNTGSNAADPVVDPRTLAQIATAIREQEWFRFGYTLPDDDPLEGDRPMAPSEPGGPKIVEPYRLVSWQRRWYLVGRYPRVGNWATFRVDWIAPEQPTRRTFEPDPMPGGDYTSFVLRDVASAGWKVHARIAVDAPADVVLARINAAVGVVESVDEERCVLVTGADSWETVAVYIGMLGLDFRVAGPKALVDHLAALAERYRRAVDRSTALPVPAAATGPPRGE